MPINLKSNSHSVQFVRAQTQKALEDIAKYIQAKAAKYPPQTSGTSYRRTGTLGRSIARGNVQKYGNGYRVEIGTSLKSARFVERGTGIYGPSGVPITPKAAKVLAWKSTRGQLKKAGLGGRGVMVASGMSKSKGKMRRYKAGDTMMIFAKTVKGMVGWKFMEKAFTSPQTRLYAQERIDRLAATVFKEWSKWM